MTAPGEPRQLPRWRDIRPLLVGARSPRRTSNGRLARCHSIEDVRTLARRKLPRAVFDYVDGGAEGEFNLRRMRQTLDAVEFYPQVLRNVAQVDLSAKGAGFASSMPLVLAPTGLTRVVHHQGESAVARAAMDARVPYSLSTMGTTALEDLANAAPEGTNWFQLYVWKDRSASQELINRAAEAGYSALVLTVDVPVAGARLRDLRNGFTVPPSLSPRTLLDMGRRPAWWTNLLTTRPLAFSSLDDSPGNIADLIGQMFDPSVTFDDIAWVRNNWSGPLIVKGVQRLDDVERLRSLGVEGVVLSNHGGRQLDRTRPPLELLPEARDRFQEDMDIFVDGGIRSGADIAAAVALGADAVLIGRPYLYGLAAGGEAGVQHVLALLRAELQRTLQLLGVTDLQQLRSGAFAGLRG